LLASDGLTDVVDEQELREIVSENRDPQQAAEELAEKAVANGGGDDVTCVVFFVQSVVNVEAPPSQVAVHGGRGSREGGAWFL
jgi:protein phosphatase